MSWVDKLTEIVEAPDFEFRTRPAPFLRTALEKLRLTPTTIVEVGVFKAQSSLVFRKTHGQARMYLVDPWRLDAFSDGQTIADKHPTQEEWDALHANVCKLFVNDWNTKILRMPSAEAARILPNNLDFVFIDGIHSYEAVKEDIGIWYPKVVNGGMLCGHDYIKKWPGVKKAVEECIDPFVVGAHGTWMHIKEAA